MSKPVDSNIFVTIGPPGTGKTFTVQRQARRAADEYGADQLCLTSYTTNAATELARADENGEPLPVEDKQIGTLHKHCFHALGKPTLAEDKIDEFNHAFSHLSLSHKAKKKTLDDPDGDVIDDDDEQHDATADDLFLRYQTLRARMTPREAWPDSVTHFAAAWEQWKKEGDYLDFTDLIDVARDNVAYLPNSASILFVDEVQDCPPNQMALIRHWAERAQFVMMSGDDDQVLYSYAGASPDVFLTPDIPQSHIRVLTQSHRVPASVHAVAVDWIERCAHRYAKEYRPRDAMGVVRSLRSTYRDPRRMIDDAETKIAAGQSVMFLTSCSYMLKPIIDELKKRGLPFHNPLRKKRGDWNPLRHGKESMTERVIAFLRPQSEQWNITLESGEVENLARMWNALDLDLWTEILTSARGKTPGVLKHGAKARIEAWKESAKAAKSFPELPIADLLDLFSDDAHLSAALDGDLDWFEASTLARQRATLAFPLHVARTHGAQALRETPRIIVGTIHSVKGGQADVVYLCPDISPHSMIGYQRGGDARDSVIRQYYVALTRARAELVVCANATTNALRLPLHAAANARIELARAA